MRKAPHPKARLRAALAGLTVAAAAALGAATPARAAYAGFPDLDAGAWYVTGGTVDWGRASTGS